MLKVLPVREKEQQEQYCLVCGIEYDPDMMSFAAFDGEKFVGISLFRIVGTDCVIYKIKLIEGIDDYLAYYLLAKAPLNFADLCGIKTAVFKDENRKLAQRLEFAEKDGEWRLNLEGYFTSPCSRHE